MALPADPHKLEKRIKDANAAWAARFDRHGSDKRKKRPTGIHYGYGSLHEDPSYTNKGSQNATEIR